MSLFEKMPSTNEADAKTLILSSLMGRKEERETEET
jgi:hypothetical protein